MAVTSLPQLFEVLGRGDTTSLLGTAEDNWIEFKREPYQLDTARGRRDLCADVASFANGIGGVIVIGIRTERIEGTKEEVAAKVRGVAKGLVDRDRLLALVRQHVRPLLQVDIRRYAATDEDRELVAIVISPQEEHDRPFIVDRVAAENESDLQHAIGWPTRHGAETDWQRVSRIQQLISNGLRGEMPPLHSASEATPVPDDASEHLTIIGELDGWQEWGRFIIQAIPRPPKQPIPDFFGAFASSVERWQGFRSSGFNLGLDHRPLERTQRSLIAADDRRFVAISRGGVVTTAAVGSPEMLGWGNYQNESRPDHVVVNPYVIVEFPSEAVRFASELVAPLVQAHVWTYRLIGEQLQDPTPLHLRPRPAHTGFANKRPPLADCVEATIVGSGDQWRDAFEIVAEVYGTGYGLGRATVPFADGERINLELMNNP